MKVVLGSDHAGTELRKLLIDALVADGHEIVETGPSAGERSDYPDNADAVVERRKEPETLGILICGSGIGISIRANRYPGVRCALCTTELMASLAREHNDANALALGARIVGVDQAIAIARAFLSALPSTEDRHRNRIGKIDSPLC